MQDAKDTVHRRISEVRAFLAQEQPPRLSESDTKANFIDPILAALGWHGLNVVTREYYVRNSQEFIDYVMRGPNGLLLAIEAKPIQTELTDKHAAQLIQYCAVEGIEWAALTNGRELQFFNTFLKPDLAAKRVLRLDLLAFNTDAEFDILFGQIWQLSRESMTQPKGVRSWLHQKRLDDGLRKLLLDPGTHVNRQLRKLLADDDISATPQELVQWFRSHLMSPTVFIPASNIAPGSAVPIGSSEVDVINDYVEGGPTPPPNSTPQNGSSVKQGGRDDSRTADRRRGSGKTAYFGVTLSDLQQSGLLPAGTRLVLVGNGAQEAIAATLGTSGEIIWNGKPFRSLSDRAFSKLLGRVSMNGWTSWVAELPSGRVLLAELRQRYLAALNAEADSTLTGS